MRDLPTGAWRRSHFFSPSPYIAGHLKHPSLSTHHVPCAITASTLLPKLPVISEPPPRSEYSLLVLVTRPVHRN